MDKVCCHDNPSSWNLKLNMFPVNPLEGLQFASSPIHFHAPVFELHHGNQYCGPQQPPDNNSKMGNFWAFLIKIDPMIAISKKAQDITFILVPVPWLYLFPLPSYKVPKIEDPLRIRGFQARTDRSQTDQNIRYIFVVGPCLFKNISNRNNNF